MRPALALIAALLLAACSEGGAAVTVPEKAAPLEPPPLKIDAPAGLYAIVPEESHIGFVVEYLDHTKVTGRFAKVEANLQLEPGAPERSSIMASIDPASVRTDIAGFDALITGPDFLDVARFPKMNFVSVNLMRTGPAAADVTGDMTLHGVTRPQTFKARYEPSRTVDAAHPRVRFVAEATLRRSDFDLEASLPLAGDPVGVADEVKVVIDAEFRRVNPTPRVVTESRSGKKSPASPE